LCGGIAKITSFSQIVKTISKPFPSLLWYSGTNLAIPDDLPLHVLYQIKNILKTYQITIVKYSVDLHYKMEYDDSFLVVFVSLVDSSSV
jgi:hypothetical protein